MGANTLKRKFSQHEEFNVQANRALSNGPMGCTRNRQSFEENYFEPRSTTLTSPGACREFTSANSVPHFESCSNSKVGLADDPVGDSNGWPQDKRVYSDKSNSHATDHIHDN